MKFYKLIPIFLLFVITIGMVSAHDNITDPINLDKNNINSVYESEENINTNSFTDLQNLINNNTNHEIILNNNYSWKDGDSLSGIILNKEIHINGNNHTLDAFEKSKIFNINTSNILIENINLKNSNLSTGGGVYCDKAVSNIVLSNISFINSAINTTTNFEMINCDFINSTENRYSYILSAENVTKYYSGKERLIINANGNNKKIDISLNGVKYSRTTNNGAASLAINLNSGNYTAHIKSKDEENKSLNVNIEIKPTIYGNDIVKVYRNGTQYFARFIDETGNALNNTNILFNINGVLYVKKTNSTGWAKLNINLNQGKYILTANNPVTGEKLSNNITVISNIYENNDLVKTYKNNSQFTVRLKNTLGNPVGSGVDVQFNINGILYTRTTNSTGHATLNINLMAGKYIITTTYNGCRESNTITVLNVYTVCETPFTGDGHTGPAYGYDQE